MNVILIYTYAHPYLNRITAFIQQKTSNLKDCLSTITSSQSTLSSYAQLVLAARHTLLTSPQL